MNILLIESDNTLTNPLRSHSCSLGDVAFFRPEDVEAQGPEASRIDLIVAAGDFTAHNAQTDLLLSWRTNPDTCLVSCWITAEWSGFKRRFLWPKLSIDRFVSGLEPEDFCRWLLEAAEWQQNRMRLADANMLQNQSPLELFTSLVLRKATGRLCVFDEEGADGLLSFRDGKLIGAEVRHLRGVEAFLDFFCWTEGAFHWDATDPGETDDDPRALAELIPESLGLIREANILFPFLPDLNVPIQRTPSQSALDDGADPAHEGRRKLYELIDGRASAALLIEASSLSRSRAMSCLARWFSLEDVTTLRAETPEGLETPSLPDLVEMSCQVSPDEQAELAFDPDSKPASEVLSVEGGHPEGPLDAGLRGNEDRELSLSLDEAGAEILDSAAGHNGNGSAPRRLLIVDDSALMCKALQSIFAEDPRFEVIGTAKDGVEALEFIREKSPDVVTLDIQMPRMDGLTALKHIMIRSPKPVVILSAFTKKTSQTTYEAFKYGAVDVLAKPSGFGGNGFEKDAGEIRNRVAEASGVRIEAVQRVRRNRMPEESTAIGDPILAAAEPGSGMPVVVVCCGAGGFSSLLCFLASWSSFKELPAMIACVDMPRKAVEIFAPSMAKDFGIPIEAVHSQPLSPGDCFLCSVEDPYRFVPTANGIGFLMPREAESPSGAFDQLLLSAAECFSQRAAAFLISGTGEDGITGMRRIQEAGGQTFALSPEACTKPELSREILNRGLAREVPSAAACARFLATWRLE